MQKPNTREKRTYIIAALLILTAMTCRISGKMGFDTMLLGYLRAGIYICLFTAWGVSLKRRIMQPQVRQLMVSIAAIMVIWLLTRTIKFNIDCPPVERQLWYFYYFPMLFIPMLSVFVAFSLGKPENFRLPRRQLVLNVSVTLALLLLVLTNDFHRLVFTFPAEHPVWTDYHYGYGAGYYIVVAWMLLCALTAFTVMALKCRVPHSRTVLLLPFFPIACTLAYAVLYSLRFPPLYFLIGDITVVFCLLFAATLESGIQCGLIQANTHYGELFRASTIAAQIADRDCRVCLSSKDARPVSAELLHKAQSSPVMLSGGTRLSGAAIRDGHIFWQEDVSGLLTILERLADTQEELRGYARLLDEENKQKQRRRELEEQKRLYDAVQQIIAPTMAQLAALLEQLNDAQDTDAAKKLHGKIAVAGAYLKRRSNLVFLADQTGTVPAGELMLCLNESVSNLRLAGTSCAVQFDLTGDINGSAAGALYDFFEAVVEAAWDELHSLNVIVTGRDAGLSLVLMLPCQRDLSALAARFPNAKIEQDEDVCYCSLIAPKGGVQL